MTVFFSGVLIACDCAGTILVDCGDIIERFSAPVAALELGLRWLHDRCEEDNQSNFVDAIKSAFPSIMTGIAHGLVLDAQQKLTDEFKGDRTTMRKLHKRARELTKRRKKNIP